MGLVVGPGYIAFSHLAWCGYAFTKDAVLFLQTKPFKFVYEKTSTSKMYIVFISSKSVLNQRFKSFYHQQTHFRFDQCDIHLR